MKNFLILLVIIITKTATASILTTKHNLSASGPGSVITTETTRVCVFCHTPHNSNSEIPLWNKDSTTAVYTLYGSPTLDATVNQPDGTSRVCLSCHDGTISVGAVKNPDITFSMANTNNGRLTGSSNLGTDLTNDHPVSFVPVVGDEINNPPAGDEVALDHSGKIQCTTCHNPHDDANGYFLVKSNQNSAICKSCHNKTGFAQSSHNLSSSTWNGAGENPWPKNFYSNVSDNACWNCHWSHGGSSTEFLLTDSAEENVCSVCHNGNVASKNVMAEFSKSSRHNVFTTSGSHSPVEDIQTVASHVECVDCHNPHSVNSSTASAPDVSGRLSNVKGADLSGNEVDPALYQYQICIKCHGTNMNVVVVPFADRQVDTSNIRLAINPSNQSYHPIAAQGVNPNVPSLISPYTTDSIIYCTDCHNSDDSVSAGGTGANGPHGSIYPYILERRYEMADYTSYSSDAYALCFKCHDPNIVLSSSSTFRAHPRHVLRGQIPCSACHDPHGVPAGSSTDGDHYGLINFDTNIVSPPSGGTLKFEVISGRGYCYVSCHGRTHNPAIYWR